MEPASESTSTEGIPSEPAKQEATSPGTTGPEGTATESGTVSLTPKAVTMIKLTREQEGLDDQCGLRVAVRGGGCSGFEYALDFEQEARATDTVLEYDGINVFVDPVSARYLAGTQIDYVLGTTGAGFKFNNPKAVGTCGCGSSFAV